MREEAEPVGTLITGFLLNTPAGAEAIKAQVSDATARGLPQVLPVRRKLTIIANGPSARGVDVALIRPTLAVNGALKLFLDQGLAPDYWAVCDPQELVADFLPDDPPMETVYLVASKCHPKVFDKLKGRKVFIWHVGIADGPPVPGMIRIPSSSSITVTATWLMFRMGYADFEYHGWDGCFMDGRHHATDNSDWSGVRVTGFNFGGVEVDDPDVKGGRMVEGGRNFPTTRTWIAEMKGAEQFFQFARYFDVGIKINGDGMFEASRKNMFGEAA